MLKQIRGGSLRLALTYHRTFHVCFDLSKVFHQVISVRPLAVDENYRKKGRRRKGRLTTGIDIPYRGDERDVSESARQVAGEGRRAQVQPLTISKVTGTTEDLFP